MLTDTLGSIIGEKADVVLAAKRGPVSAFHSLVVPMTIINTILLEIANQNQEVVISNLDNLDQLRDRLKHPAWSLNTERGDPSWPMLHSLKSPSPNAFQASSRRFIHWLTKPHVFLALIMLVVMFYMVIIPLYKLVETTATWQPVDVSRIDGAVEGELTLYHWKRMLTGIFGRIYTYTPLTHSMTIAIGTVAACAVYWWITGLAGSTHRYAWPKAGQSTGGAALHHAFLDPGSSLVGAVQEQDHRWSTGNV